jgi:methylated-DNA-[protein]-cysteine S-methyltransferase
MKIISTGHTDDTAIGRIWVAMNEKGLVAVEFPAIQFDFEAWLKHQHRMDVRFDPEKVKGALEQLQQYVTGERREFTIPIDWSVLNDFQQKALKITIAIPYGETRTYKEIALELGNPHAARAVGRAEATNPMPIVIPCHRVVGSDGKLRGYGAGAGLDTKAWLLKLEGAVIT